MSSFCKLKCKTSNFKCSRLKKILRMQERLSIAPLLLQEIHFLVCLVIMEKKLYIARMGTLESSLTLSSVLCRKSNSSLNRPLRAKCGKARMQAKTSNSPFVYLKFKFVDAFDN